MHVNIRMYMRTKLIIKSDKQSQLLIYTMKDNRTNVYSRIIDRTTLPQIVKLERTKSYEPYKQALQADHHELGRRLRYWSE